MSRSTVAILLIQLVVLMNGCSDSPPKPVLPDGSHRVPVNRVQPVPPSDRGSHEQ
ncbi:hypothetical protein FEQ05_03202 [Burkholderia pseudomultivorans]|uniref:Lipoprotein n=1 Tax=Burkholderia pseudomultivorans TaxID=1207504 RepID=A0ABU2E5C0_9BURK|nr:hypothetical protein [Burkholderia pseudomultivorans]MDR8737473.1 hypothetical protein [Burkholderia pseudomultivorans]MDR8743818.1 hypothetical protein [Burkholderia pseudomultivorans]MDR8755068.1 hypothetical protein [Burkholderia pseudomultivorans]MDR8780193.1 hypothetical protein [Burkholderia pseudomultivorans]